MIDRAKGENMDNQEGGNMFFNESDVEFSTAKSGGPGGQNVNKRETAAEARISVKKLRLTDKERQFVRDNFTPNHQYVEEEDAVFVARSGIKSQQQARKRALEGLQESIKEAVDKGWREVNAEKHRKRADRRRRSGGGSKKHNDNKKSHEIQKGRNLDTSDWLSRAMQEDPDLAKRFEQDNGETE